ncbi:hypothetical protein RHSIM_Rhsim03G0116400 [Rhododendron simsii]|uniref:Secreted protein n=1 Tax=Rhododendron simsii TaxID=118357 RepID=A0A834LTN4_RHOSS|nr:hypothetical protein RHSIM_Rhsim03G0116400 [Rhododendron simsii]
MQTHPISTTVALLLHSVRAGSSPASSLSSRFHNGSSTTTKSTTTTTAGFHEDDDVFSFGVAAVGRDEDASSPTNCSSLGSGVWWSVVGGVEAVFCGVIWKLECVVLYHL